MSNLPQNLQTRKKAITTIPDPSCCPAALSGRKLSCQLSTLGQDHPLTTHPHICEFNQLTSVISLKVASMTSSLSIGLKAVLKAEKNDVRITATVKADHIFRNAYNTCRQTRLSNQKYNCKNVHKYTHIHTQACTCTPRC